MLADVEIKKSNVVALELPPTPNQKLAHKTIYLGICLPVILEVKG